MRGSRKFCQRGSASDVFLFDFTVFFLLSVFVGGLVDGGREDPNTMKNGPGPMMAQRMLAW